MSNWHDSTKPDFDDLDQPLALQGDAGTFRISERDLQFITQAYKRTIRWTVSLGLLFITGVACASLLT